jgi:S1-C subfamily serine protease
MRAFTVAALCLLLTSALSGQATGVLRIRVTVIDAQGHSMPVPRHALLISDEPPTTVPRRTVTGLDGTTTVTLRPGTYIVESDTPVAFDGKSYDWAQPVEISAGLEVLLELTPKNAEVGAATAATTPLAAPVDTDPMLRLQPWQGSVVAVWTPTARTSAFLFDSRGLLATTQRPIGSATTVEVQITSDLKVPGRVVAADQTKNAAVIRIDPSVLETAKAVPLGCGSSTATPLGRGQTVYTIGFAAPEPKSLVSGEVKRAEGRAIVTDLILTDADAGGPLFFGDGTLAGITYSVDDPDARSSDRIRVIPVADVCAVVDAAGARLTADAAPAPVHLPIEPTRAFPADVLKNAPRGAAVNRTEYMATAQDFDIAFITPLLAASAQGQDRGAARVGSHVVNAQPASERALVDFVNWSDYVSATPPVVMIRVTPRLVEGFWTKVARGAAMTQGTYIPSLKHFKSGFSRMRVLCGDAEVTPIHPFIIEHPVSDTETLNEGLYVFDPDALGPQCSSVRLVLYSQKSAEKGDTRPIDPKVIQRVWQDFAAWRQ